MIDETTEASKASPEIIQDSTRSLLDRLLEQEDKKENSIIDALGRCADAVERREKPTESDYITLVAVVAAGGGRFDGELNELRKRKKEFTHFTDINPKPLQGGDMNQSKH